MPAVHSRVFRNSYRDSVELMQIAAEIESLAGIDRAGLVMATPANREVLAAAGLLSEAAAAAGPNDLVVAIASGDESAAIQALERAAARLSGPGTEGPSETTRTEARTLAEGVAELGAANLALISTPGIYATAEALKALKARGWKRGHTIEIPHGPLCSFSAPGGQRIAVYQLARPEVEEHFAGRRDF